MRVLNELKRYIRKVLGTEVNVKDWSPSAELPFFLRDAYNIANLCLMGNDYLLMVDLQKDSPTPAIIKKNMGQIQKRWDGEIIYVCEQVTAYNRDRMVHNHIPFIVPGNQLYLPMLAIDLREHFALKRTKVKRFSPATQVLVLHSIYQYRNIFDKTITLTQWGQELGYTKMTITRAFRDMRTVLETKEHLETLCGRKLWEAVKPYLRSPVKRRRYYDVGQVKPAAGYWAGLSAMARLTMIAESDHNIVCMDNAQWKSFQTQCTPVELERAESGALEIEIWSYSPEQFAHQGVADPLSIYLSLERNRDERIEAALAELLENMSW